MGHHNRVATGLAGMVAAGALVLAGCGFAADVGPTQDGGAASAHTAQSATSGASEDAANATMPEAPVSRTMGHSSKARSDVDQPEGPEPDSGDDNASGVSDPYDSEVENGPQQGTVVEECIYGGGAWTGTAFMSDGSVQPAAECQALRDEQLTKYPYQCPGTDHHVAGPSKCAAGPGNTENSQPQGPEVGDPCIGADIGKTAIDDGGNPILCDNYSWAIDNGQEPTHPWVDDQRAWAECTELHTQDECRELLND